MSNLNLREKLLTLQVFYVGRLNAAPRVSD